MAHQYTCGREGCAFVVRSADQAEVVEYAREHARDKHAMQISAANVEAEIEVA